METALTLSFMSKLYKISTTLVSILNLSLSFFVKYWLQKDSFPNDWVRSDPNSLPRIFKERKSLSYIRFIVVTEQSWADLVSSSEQICLMLTV